MTIRTVRLPDVGEGIAEAELVSWFVTVGDTVTSDTVVAEVLTDKATVEIYAPVAGTIAFVRGEPGDVLAIGSDFVGIDVGDSAPAPPDSVPAEERVEERGEEHVEERVEEHVEDEPVAIPADVSSALEVEDSIGHPSIVATSSPHLQLVPDEIDDAPVGASGLAAPAVRERARELGIDLTAVAASAPDGRITHGDLDRHLAGPQLERTRPDRSTARLQEPGEVALIGLRRKIATRMTTAWRIPHITYVDEVDMSALEHLRSSMATEHPDRQRVTVLPFVMRAIVLAVSDQPNLNATFDDESQPQTVTNHADVHIGIATQTPSGLIVPVVHDAQALDLWEAAAELARVTEAARNGTMTREESTGSTITITSLGALGGLATTPIINHPEVAIVGINKMQIRPVWDGAAFVPRKMMNISSSFDHRVVDGWDAATFIQRIKTLLEEPALLFV